MKVFLYCVAIFTVYILIANEGFCKKRRRGKKGTKRDLASFKRRLERHLKSKSESFFKSEKCGNLVPWCHGYKSYCKTEKIVKQYCQKMCGMCEKGNCMDRHPQCRLVVRKKWCKYYGQKYCQKSCGLCTESKCGVAPLSPTVFQRIVNGLNAKPGFFPWQVGIYLEGKFHCGGGLIDKRYVLSAAHCFDGLENSFDSMEIKIGDVDRSEVEAKEQTFRIEKVVVHQDFNYDDTSNDIALIKLSDDVRTDKEYVGTICLAEESDERPVDSFCFISGWGLRYHTGDPAKILQYASVPVADRQLCKKTNTWKPVTDRNICTGYNNGMNFETACFGDSGGPLSCVDTNGVWKLHGVVSWGHPQCNALGGYSVFTKVNVYLDWIKKHM